MFFHDGEAMAGGGRVVNEAIAECFDVALDDGQRGPKFVGGIGHEVFAYLLCEDLFGDVVNHQPGTAFSLCRQRGGLDEVMASTGAVCVIAADKADLTYIATAFCERHFNGFDNLMVVDFIEQGVVALDGGSLKQLGDVAIGESDFEVSIDNEDALSDFAEEGLE